MFRTQSFLQRAHRAQSARAPELKLGRGQCSKKQNNRTKRKTGHTKTCFVPVANVKPQQIRCKQSDSQQKSALLDPRCVPPTSHHSPETQSVFICCPSTWSAQMDQQIKKRLKGKYRRKWKGEDGAASLTQAALSSCRHKRWSKMWRKDSGGENEEVSRHPVLYRCPTVIPNFRIPQTTQVLSFGPWTWCGPLEWSEAL